MILYFFNFFVLLLSRCFFLLKIKEKWREGKRKIKKKGMNKMKFIVCGRAKDIEQMVDPMIREKGEKLKITVWPEPLESDGTRRYCVEVETKKNEEKREVLA